MYKTIRFIFILLTVALCSIPSAQASIYGDSVQFADLHDQRTFALSSNYDPELSEGGLSGYWPYAFMISWDITYDVNTSLWHYEYNLSVEKKDISHFILEVSDTAQNDDITHILINGSPASAEGPQTWSKAGNQTIPNAFYGIKFNEGGSTATYSFDSILDPVWGNFYAKGGVDKGNLINAYNTALGVNNFSSNNKLDFIVRPNGGNAPPVVPEPISSTLFIAGGATLWFKRFRNKIKK